MGNFNRDDRRSGGGFNRGSGDRKPSFGGGRSFGGGGRSFGGGRDGGRDGGRPTMHPATCSECGADCQLPFRPTGDRPVFCSNCFDKQGGGSARPPKFGGDRFSERREGSRDDKHMHDAICAKCGETCQVPFKPMIGKPVYCTNCFEKPGSKETNEIMEQIKRLNEKVDKLVKMLTPNALVEKNKPEVKKEVVVKEVTKEKSKTKAAPKKVVAKKKK